MNTLKIVINFVHVCLFARENLMIRRCAVTGAAVVSVTGSLFRWQNFKTYSYFTGISTTSFARARVRCFCCCCCWASDLFSFTDRMLLYCLSHKHNTQHTEWVFCFFFIFRISCCVYGFFVFLSVPLWRFVYIERGSLLWSNGPVRGISRNVLLASVTSIPKSPPIDKYYQNDWRPREKKPVNISSWRLLITTKIAPFY